MSIRKRLNCGAGHLDRVRVVHSGEPAIAVLGVIDREGGNLWMIAEHKPEEHLTVLHKSMTSHPCADPD